MIKYYGIELIEKREFFFNFFTIIARLYQLSIDGPLMDH